MTRACLMGILLAATAFGAGSKGVEGDWHGTLNTGMAGLRLGLRITRSAGGTLAAKLDSYDQNALGLPVDTVQFDGTRLRFAMSGLNAKYEGALSQDGSKIEGTFTQNGAALPLTFERGPYLPASRPQRAKASLSVPRGGCFLPEQGGKRDAGGNVDHPERAGAVSRGAADYRLRAAGSR